MEKIKKYILASSLITFALAPVLAFATAPTILTDNAVNITFNSADLNGQLTGLGRSQTSFYTKAQVWFEYGKTTAYGSQSAQRTISGTDSFTEKLSGLSACSTYHFRAVAKNESETAYGNDKSFTTPCQIEAQIKVEVQNLTSGDGAYHSQTQAKAEDELSFKITVESIGASTAKNIQVKNVLPKNITYQNELKISGVADGRDIAQNAISVGDLSPRDSKTITFSAKVGPASGLPTGANTLLNTAIVYTTESANTASCVVVVQGTGAGVPTAVNTGIGTDILYSVLLPLLAAFVLVSLFKSQIIGLDKVFAERKTKVDNFRVLRKLNKLIQKRK